MTRLASILLLAGVLACGESPPSESDALALPEGFPRPIVPSDNPVSAAKIALGRHLFYDVRLSGNRTQSCASCHRQELAFTDGQARSLGSTGETTRRNSMSLANVAYAATLTWANSTLLTLEDQMHTPLFGAEPVELGLRGREDELLARLRDEPRYGALFESAWPSDADPFTLKNVIGAIASFERALVSGHSSYDRFTRGDKEAISAAARRGAELFASERLECFHCHAGFNFQDSVGHEGGTPKRGLFHNTALYDVDGRGAYPPEDPGLFELTGRGSDMGRFRVPSLRNVAVTAPYMHDGSIPTLDAVLDHYAAGGRSPNNPLKSGFLRGFTLSPAERDDVIAFLHSLTDEKFLHDPSFADPW